MLLQEHKRTPRAEVPTQQHKAGGLIKHIMHHQLLAEEDGALSTTNVGQHAAQQFLGQSAAQLLQVGLCPQASLPALHRKLATQI